MPLKTHTIEEPNLNLTPMIDIVFLLIIFFMVGTRFAEMERQYDIELPSVSQAQPLTTLPDDITINVRRSGEIIVNGTPKTMDELKTELVAASTNYQDQAVLVRGEGQGPYQYVIDVVAACKEANIRVISLAYRLEDKGKP